MLRRTWAHASGAETLGAIPTSSLIVNPWFELTVSSIIVDESRIPLRDCGLQFIQVLSPNPTFQVFRASSVELISRVLWIALGEATRGPNGEKTRVVSVTLPLLPEDLPFIADFTRDVIPFLPV